MRLFTIGIFMRISRTAALLGVAGLLLSGSAYSVLGKLNDAKARRAAVAAWESSDDLYFTRGIFDTDLVVVPEEQDNNAADLILDEITNDPDKCVSLKQDFGFASISSEGRTVKLECRQVGPSEGQPERFWDSQEAELR
jgi:hypothetical protein